MLQKTSFKNLEIDDYFVFIYEIRNLKSLDYLAIFRKTNDKEYCLSKGFILYDFRKNKNYAKPKICHGYAYSELEVYRINMDEYISNRRLQSYQEN